MPVYGHRQRLLYAFRTRILMIILFVYTANTIFYCFCYNFTALRISNILDIPVNAIRKNNLYKDMETLPKPPSDKERLMINMEKKAYFSDRTLKIIKIG